MNSLLKIFYIAASILIVALNVYFFEQAICKMTASIDFANIAVNERHQTLESRNKSKMTTGERVTGRIADSALLEKNNHEPQSCQRKPPANEGILLFIYCLFFYRMGTPGLPLERYEHQEVS